MIFRDILEDLYLNQRVRIAVGDKSYNQFITATVFGLENGIYLLLKDIKAVDDNYSMSIKNMILNGGFSRIALRLDTDITVIRDEKLTQLLQ